jgi:DNA-binding winged helix-turn-helix (wHTH) protein
MVTPSTASQAIEFGPFRLDAARRELRRGGRLVPLTPKVFDTLLALVDRRHAVARRAELMAALWPDSAVEDANLTQNVFTLRKALREREDGQRYIATLPRRGYRFVAAVHPVAPESSRRVPPQLRAVARWCTVLVAAGALIAALAP